MISWLWLAIAASALWGATYVVSQYLLTTMGIVPLMWLTNTVLSIGLSVSLIWQHKLQATLLKLQDPKIGFLSVMYAMLYLLASTFILKSIKAGNAPLAAIIESSYPVFTLLFAYIFLKDVHFNKPMFLGMGLIIAGIVIIEVFGSQLPQA